VRHKSFIAVAVLLLAMLAGAIAVYAYDASRDDLIADGISAGGVDLGGLRAAEARIAIDEQLARPLRRPLVVKYEGRRFRLTAADARLRVAAERMVQEALAKSREGNVISRTLREIRGEDPTEATLPARVSYSRRAVERLVKRVEAELNQPPEDAQVTFGGASLGTVEGQPGVAVKAARLRRAIRAELVLPAADRVVKVSTAVVQPDVTRAELAARYPYVITIDRPRFRLHFWRNLKLVKSYTVAIGAVGYDTPAGLYSVQNKAVNPAWTMPHSDWVPPEDRGKVIPGGVPENPLKARWLGIYDGAGIHGTDVVGSLGSAASHGCIRMAIPDVIELYDQVPVGTPVYIA
jgi:lipoprotein-anchoring transpeptidase ErfK/SrfK